MIRYRILPGLPGTGPVPVQFSYLKGGRHKEGLVVDFYSEGDKSVWIGNFQPGLTNYSDVTDHPKSDYCVVIAGGQGYVVNRNSAKLVECLGGTIISFLQLPEYGLTLLIENDNLIALDAEKIIWTHYFNNVDGIQGVRLVSRVLTGEVNIIPGDIVDSFMIDPLTGKIIDVLKK